MNFVDDVVGSINTFSKELPKILVEQGADEHEIDKLIVLF